MRAPAETLASHKLTTQAYQDLLDEARASASTAWEIAFVTDMKARFLKFGLGAYVSTSQLYHLRKIAQGADE